MTYHKTALFESDLQELSALAKTLAHPARLAILRYLANANTCISGDITDEIPLSRTTVSQHLQELKKAGLIHGEIDGTKVCYCICKESVERAMTIFNSFFNEVNSSASNNCSNQY
jgi:DNA-binding transcriptional ArsR family regulator